MAHCDSGKKEPQGENGGFLGAEFGFPVGRRGPQDRSPVWEWLRRISDGDCTRVIPQEAEQRFFLVVRHRRPGSITMQVRNPREAPGAAIFVGNSDEAVGSQTRCAIPLCCQVGKGTWNVVSLEQGDQRIH